MDFVSSNLLNGVAQLLRPHGHDVLAVNAGALLAGTLFDSEREALLHALLREAREAGAALALEQAESIAAGVPRSAVILCDALERGVRLIATAAPDEESRFAVGSLAARLEVIRLHEMCAGDALQVLENLRPFLAPHHRVRIAADVEKAAIDRSLSLPGALPGKAVTLLDTAAARARLNQCESVLLIDVLMAAARMLGESE